MVIDVLDRDDLPFPNSLPEFQQLFPNEAACAAYLERALERRIHLSALRDARRALSLCYPPRCSLLPEVPARSLPHCWHRHGTHTYAAYSR